MRVAHRLRNSLTARTLIGSAITGAVLVAAFAILVIAIGSLRQAGRAALRAQQAVSVGTELERSAIALESGLRGHVATGRADSLESFDAARRAYPEQVDRLRALARDDAALRADVERVSELIGDYIDLWALPLLATTRENPRAGRALLFYRTGQQRIRGVRDALKEMFGRARAEAAATERRAESRADLAVWLGIVGIVLVVLVAGGAALLLRRRVMRPLQNVARASGAIAGGDLGVRVATDRQDELGYLMRSFNEMAAALGRQRALIAARTQDLERSNRELQDYASVTSHDLQGPLVTIGMYAGLLERKLADDAEARALAAHIRTGAERMRDLVRDLLAYARLDREELRPEPVDLDALLAETLAVAGRSAPRMRCRGGLAAAADGQRRRGPVAPGAAEPALERDQVLRRGRGAAGVGHEHARIGADGAHLGARQRDRVRHGARRGDLPAVPSPALRRPLRGDRHRARGVSEDRRAARWADLGRERARPRRHDPLHTAGGGAAGALAAF